MSTLITDFFTARTELRKVLFLTMSVCAFLFVYEISREPLNAYALNLHGKHVWLVAPMSLKVKVTRDKNSIFRPFRRPAYSLCLVKHF